MGRIDNRQAAMRAELEYDRPFLFPSVLNGYLGVRRKQETWIGPEFPRRTPRMTSTGSWKKLTQKITHHAGIDISKDHLDVHIVPGDHAKRFANTKTGWRALAKWLSAFAPDRIVYESTGPYHKALTLIGQVIYLNHVDATADDRWYWTGGAEFKSGAWNFTLSHTSRNTDVDVAPDVKDWLTQVSPGYDIQTGPRAGVGLKHVREVREKSYMLGFLLSKEFEFSPPN